MIRLVLVLALLLSGLPAQAERVTVFAAASLGAVLEDVAAEWRTETGHTAVIAPAGSSALARQVAAGAPVDVVILANPSWMDWLESRDAIARLTRRNLLTNQLILIAHKSAPDTTLTKLPGQLGDHRLAMALVDAVPAGIYARTALDTLGLWSSVEPRVVQADNVTAAYTLVRSGAVGYGIVYATDLRPDSPVRRLATIPADSHPPILYPAAVVTGAGPLAQEFLNFLSRTPAQRQFRRFGFDSAP